MHTLQRFFASTSAAVALAFGLFAAQPAAQSRPDDATARCKDGTYSTAKTRQGACAGHGGVQTWYAGGGTKTAAKEAKEDTKDAAKSTKNAAKSAGKATKNGAEAVGEKSKDVAKDVAKGTKGVAKDVAKGSKDVAKDVKNDVKPRPSTAPDNATAKCKDGTYSHATTHRGACSNHGGVAEWYK